MDQRLLSGSADRNSHSVAQRLLAKRACILKILLHTQHVKYPRQSGSLDREDNESQQNGREMQLNRQAINQNNSCFKQDVF
jgi:hypothetical protein